MPYGVDAAMTFEQWWKENNDELYSLGTKEIIALAWEAATKAENERCVKICRDRAEAFWDHSPGAAACTDEMEIK